MLRRIVLLVALTLAGFALAPPRAAALPQQDRVIVSAYGPGSVTYDGATTHLVASPDDLSGVLRSTGTPANDGGVWRVEWKHDPDREPDGTNGPLHPVTVELKLEKRSNEDNRAFARRCKALLDEHLAITPPNVPE